MDRTQINNRVILRQYLVNGNNLVFHNRILLTLVTFILGVSWNPFQEMANLNGGHLLTLIDKTTTHSHLNLDLMIVQSSQVANVYIAVVKILYQ